MSGGLYPAGIQPTGCAGCLACQYSDGRQGLRVDISGCLPTVGSWTSHINGTENNFEIDSINWAIDTSKPVYFGQEVNGSGHINLQCCEKYIGSMVATWTNPTEGVELSIFHWIYLGVTSNEVYMRFFHYVGTGTGSDFPYFFRWYKSTSGYPSESESPLCSIKRAAWTSLGNTQLADYDSAKIYITESDGYEIDVIPTYGNQDGGYLHPGTGDDAMNAVDIADPSNCQECSLVEDWKITISGMSSICINSLMKPGDNAAELPFTITDGIFFINPLAMPTPTDATGTGANCSGDPLFVCFDPTNVSTYTVSASVDFLGIAWTGFKMFRATIVITCECPSTADQTTSGVAYFDLTCGGGIVSDSQSVTLSGGAGSVTVDIVPA